MVKPDFKTEMFEGRSVKLSYTEKKIHNLVQAENKSLNIYFKKNYITHFS